MAAALAMALLVSRVAFAAPVTYALDPQHTVPAFAVEHEGVSVQRGLFGRASGTVTFDAEARTGTIDVAVDTASVVTGDALRDRFLRGEDFFDADRYPAAIFRASRVVYEGDRPVGADGELTLRGITRPLHVDIGPVRCGEQFVTRRPVCGAEIVATLKRSAFGMTAFARAIGDDVTLTIQAEAVPQK
jgi:polyisoprenoid-binding protein YceI